MEENSGNVIGFLISQLMQGATQRIIMGDRVKEKSSADVSFFLIRFKEGTEINDEYISKLGKIKWSEPFIPVVGVEINIDEKDKLLDGVKNLKGYIKIREVSIFHEFSFMDI